MQVPNRSRRSGAEDPAGRALADGLGCFSVGLGAAQIAAPQAFTRKLGVADNSRHRMLVRGIGAREIAQGIGVLSGWTRPVGLWSRLAGDAMDLALLGAALSAKSRANGFGAIRSGAIGRGAIRNRARRRRSLETAIASVAGLTMLDLLAAVRETRTARLPGAGGAVHEKASVTVKRPIGDVYRYWHDFGNLPHFMAHLQSVSVIGPRRSRWRSRWPAEVEWDIEVTGESVNEFIEWRSVDGAAGEHSGSVRFAPAPGARGTEVTVELDYAADGAVPGLAKLAAEKLEHELRDDLRRFKQVLETGEVVRSEGSPAGSSTSGLLKQRPAQPLP